MSTRSIKSGIASFAFAALITASAAAQTTAPAGTTPATVPTQVQQPTPARVPESNDPRKADFQKHLDEIQPNVNELTTKAATANNEEFSTESKKLNAMVTNFKAKLGRFDNVPVAQREQYVESLKKDWSDITEQKTKADGMLKKSEPSKNSKSTPKTAAPKQPSNK